MCAEKIRTPDKESDTDQAGHIPAGHRTWGGGGERKVRKDGGRDKLRKMH